MKYYKLGMLLAVVFTVFGLASFRLHAYAEPFDPLNPPTVKICDPDTNNSAACSTQRTPNENPVTGPNGIISKVANIIAAVGGVIAVAMIVYGGLQLILSGGESQKVASGRNIIIYSAIGIVVIVTARSIIWFVLNKVITN